jgi:hypothetical protein
MVRETRLKSFEVFLMPGDELKENEWRARIDISSEFKKTEDSKDLEYFESYIALPIKDGNTSPAKIKKETLAKLRDVFVEVLEWLNKQVK